MLGMSLTFGICLIFKKTGKKKYLVLGEVALFRVICPPRNAEHFRTGKNGLKKKKNCAKLLSKIMPSDRGCS
jgi:hypothetical protein